MTNQWSVEETDDIQEVDKMKKPSAKAPFDKNQGDSPKQVPGEEMGSSGEHEEQPDQDQEAAP